MRWLQPRTHATDATTPAATRKAVSDWSRNSPVVHLGMPISESITELASLPGG